MPINKPNSLKTLEKTIPHAPFHRHLGAKFSAVRKGRAEVRLKIRREFLQVEGVVQGGVIASLADMAAVYTIHPGLAEGETMTSVEFKLNFLAPAREGVLVAKARTVKRGRSIALAEADVFLLPPSKKRARGEGTLVAKGLFTYFIYRKR
jgi:uncharacterized protein (TIGR00369 family)